MSFTDHDDGYGAQGREWSCIAAIVSIGRTCASLPAVDLVTMLNLRCDQRNLYEFALSCFSSSGLVDILSDVI